MTIEERLEQAEKLVAEVKAELAAKAAPRRNWPEKVEAGMVAVRKTSESRPMNAARRTLAPRLILAAAILAGCRMPTEPTPSAVREAMQPDTARIVTEVDALPRSFRAPINGQCDSGMVIVLVRAAWVRGETVASDTFRVARCGRGI